MIFRAALVSQCLLLVYYQLIEWVNLFPWNDVRRGNVQAKLDVIMGVILIVILFATWRRLRWIMAGGVVLYAVWLWLQIKSWWLPYFNGASPGWKRVYARYFAQTIQWMSSDADHLAPDACHIVLQVLILVAFTTTAIAARGLLVGLVKKSK